MSGNVPPTLYRIHPETMSATPLATFAAQSRELVADPSGAVWVLDTTSSPLDRVLRFDPLSHDISLVFENGASSGPFAGLELTGMGFLDADTALFSATGSALAGNTGLLTYSLSTGATSVLAEGGDMAVLGGGVPAMARQIAVSRDGRIFVASDGFCGVDDCWGVVEVDPNTGSQTEIASGQGVVQDLE